MWTAHGSLIPPTGASDDTRDAILTRDRYTNLWMVGAVMIAEQHQCGCSRKISMLMMRTVVRPMQHCSAY